MGAGSWTQSILPSWISNFGLADFGSGDHGRSAFGRNSQGHAGGLGTKSQHEISLRRYRIRTRLFRYLSASLLALTAFGQTSLVNGALEGSVIDASGARIPGVEVRLRETSTQRIRRCHPPPSGLS